MIAGIMLIQIKKYFHFIEDDMLHYLRRDENIPLSPAPVTGTGFLRKPPRIPAALVEGKSAGVFQGPL
jgi:hypothetical protein